MEFTPVWNEFIAWYLFLAGLGGGAFASSFLLARRCPGTEVLVRAGRLIAPVVVAVGLLLLMFDARGGLYHPLRFALLLTNLGSVMTWGVVFLSAFEVVALVVAVLDLLKRSVPRALDAVGAVLALCVAVYTGALLGACAPYPLWNLAILPVLFLLSALSAGAAAVLGVGAAAAPDAFGKAELLKHVHFFVLIAEACVLVLLLVVTATTSAEGALSVASLTTGFYAPFFWGVLVACGLVFPIVVDGSLMVRERKVAQGLKAAESSKTPGAKVSVDDMPVSAAASATGETESAPAEVPAPEAANGAAPAKASDALVPATAVAPRVLSALACLGVLAGGFTLRWLIVMAAQPTTLIFPWL